MFQVYSKMNQLYICIYLFLFGLFSHMGHYRILSRFPCAIEVGSCYKFILESNFIFFIYLFFNFLSFFAISWAAPTAYGGFQARGPIGAVATSQHQSHSNAGSEPHLRPTPKLTATPDP